MKTNMLAFLTMVFFTLVVSSTYADNLTATQHFEMGAKLIEDNHYDAMGSTNAGMEAGILHVKEALRLSFPDKKRAYLLLVDSYGQWPIHPEWGSDADKKLLDDRDHYLQLLYQLDPNDREILTRYAELTPDKNEQLRAYKKLTELYPKVSLSHASLALHLLDAGNISDGIAEIKVWLGLENNPPAINTYVRSAVDLLAGKGCVVPSQDTWNPRFLKIRLNLEAGSSNVREQAQLSFKKTKQEFFEALDKTKCP